MRRYLVQAAVKRAGGQTAVAREFGVHQTAVSKWCKSGRVPAERVLLLERLSGVSRTLLRPDLYPPVNGSQPEQAA